jgi:hypothetical protein
MNERIITISYSNWHLTWQRLRASSNGQAESACIWAGERRQGNEEVQKVYFLDELPNVQRARLYHRTSREATSRLFEELRRAGHSIIADVHTHPTDWVGLSQTDEAHPIEYRIGLVALVFPFFATGKMELSRVGVHEYLGSGEWNQLTSEEATSRIQIEL